MRHLFHDSIIAFAWFGYSVINVEQFIHCIKIEVEQKPKVQSSVIQTETKCATCS